MNSPTLNTWLKIRPTLLASDGAAIELVALAQRSDGLYQRSFAARLVDLQNEGGFTVKRLNVMLRYLENAELYKLDDREAKVEMGYSYVGATSELQLPADALEDTYWKYAQSQ